MTGIIDQQVLEIMQLWRNLIIKNVELQFSGKEQAVIIQRIDQNLPLAGCEVTIPQTNPVTGKVHMVTKKIIIKDDLGHIIHSPEELGGQCIKGEYAHKDFIFTCHECGELFCSKHIRFLDRMKKETPLCYYGFLGRDGCYYNWKRFIKEKDKIAKIGAKTEVIDARTVQEEAEARHLETEIKKKQLKRQKSSIGGSVFAGILAPPIRCPICGFSPPRFNVTCTECGTAFQITKTSSRACPNPACGAVITSARCKCGETIYF